MTVQSVPVVVRRRRAYVDAISLHAGGQEHVGVDVVDQGHLSDVAGGGGADSIRRRVHELQIKVEQFLEHVLSQNCVQRLKVKMSPGEICSS